MKFKNNKQEEEAVEKIITQGNLCTAFRAVIQDLQPKKRIAKDVIKVLKFELELAEAFRNQLDAQFKRRRTYT